MVLFSHSFVLTGRAGEEPIAGLLGHWMDGGGLAVSVFFVLSGFLITRSADLHSPWAFARARAARIVPGYALVLVVQTLVLGAAVSALPAPAFWTDGATWRALARGLAFSPALGLPGVFGHNPLPYEVNGSLWTLRIEVGCYAGAGALAAAGLARPWVGLLVWGCLGALLGAWGGDARGLAVLRCLFFFSAGMAIWLWRGRIVLRWWAAAAVMAAIMGLRGTALGGAALFVGLPYLVLFAGLGVWGASWTRPRHDVSYGVYLWAFPVQQCVVLAMPQIGPYGLAAASVGPVLALGFLSHRWVEAPALRLK